MRRLQGMSFRRFATHMKVSRTTVNKWKANGTLDPAILPDGSLDVEVAEHCVREMRKARVPRKELTEQRAYHLHQRIVAARAEVDDLDDNTVPAAYAKVAVRHMMTAIAAHIQAWTPDPSDLRSSAHTLLADLTELDTGRPTVTDTEPPEPTFTDPRAELEFLKARRLRLKNELASGDRVQIDDVAQSVETALAVAKSLILNLPARFTDGDDIAAFLDTEVPPIVQALGAT